MKRSQAESSTGRAAQCDERYGVKGTLSSSPGRSSEYGLKAGGGQIVNKVLYIKFGTYLLDIRTKYEILPSWDLM